MAGSALQGLQRAVTSRYKDPTNPIGQAPPPSTGQGTTGGPVYDPRTNSYVQQDATPTMGTQDPAAIEQHLYNRSRNDAQFDADTMNKQQMMRDNSARSTMEGMLRGSETMSGSSGGGIGEGGGMASSIEAPKLPDRIGGMRSADTSRADSAAFAHAKDQVGQTASGALTGLRSALAGRGMLGSGMESRGAAAIINRGQGELGDVSRQQAITDVNLEQDTNKTNQAAAIAQRGQDIGAGSAAFSGQLTQRGQDIQQQESQAQLQQQQAQMQMQQRQKVLEGLMKTLY